MRSRTVSFRALLSFFLPLAGMSFLMSVSHAIINSCLNRSERPFEMLAAYAMAMVVNGFLEGPTVLLRQVAAVRVEHREDWRSLHHLQLLCAALQLVLGGLMAFSSWGLEAFVWLAGGQQSLALEAQQAYQWLLLVPVISGYRMMCYGLLIRNERGRFVVLSMGVRALLMVLVGLFLLSQGWVPSASRGTLIYLGGMLVDFTVSVAAARRLIQGLPDSDSRPGHSLDSHGRFFLPLAASSWTTTAGAMVFIAALSHFGSDTRSIATWETAQRLIWVLAGPCTFLHCLPLQFPDPRARSAILRFCLAVGGASVVLILACALPPLGPLILSHAVGVSPAMGASVSVTLLAVGLYPFLTGLVEFLGGALLAEGRTAWTLLARFAAVGCSTLILSALLLWTSCPGHLAAAFAFTAQAVVELGVVSLPSRNRFKKLSPAATTLV